MKQEYNSLSEVSVCHLPFAIFKGGHMHALVLDEELRFVEDYPTPTPAPGEALIRVCMVGICNTDMELVRGYMQFRGVPGHEFVGVVERAPGAEAWESQRIVGDINAACGRLRDVFGRTTHSLPPPYNARHQRARWGIRRVSHTASGEPVYRARRNTRRGGRVH